MEEIKDMTAPVNRLVLALEATADKATISSDQMESLEGELAGVTKASHELGNRLETVVGRPVAMHGDALQRVHEQFATMAGKIEQAAKLMGEARHDGAGSGGDDGKLLGELRELRNAMGETNTQLKTLIGRIDGVVVTEHKPGLFGRIFGGGSSGPGKT